MKRQILAILFLTIFELCFSAPNGSTFDKNLWYHFSLSIGNNIAPMVLYFFENDSVKGNYYQHCEKKILLEGCLKKDVLSLTEYCDNRVHGHIEARISADSNTIHGIWFNSTRTKKMATFFSLQNTSAGTFEHMYTFGFYGVPDGTDEQVESFAQTLKSAIIEGNKNWMADNILYPIDIRIDKKRIFLNNKQEFFNEYNKIIGPDLIKFVKGECTHNLYMRPRGAIFCNFYIGYAPYTIGLPDNLFILSIN